MNHIIDELIDGKIESFVYEYLKLSRNIFKNQDGTSYHNGEFGMYREKIVAELLRPLLPRRLSIGTGFIVTKNNNISTQCDLIIYDNTTTPFFENYDQRFFPVEVVAGVVEVKSKMSKSQFCESLIKLANIKKLKADSQNELYIFRDKGDNKIFDTTKNVRDQIATFLICEEFTFDIGLDLDLFYKDIYENIDKSLYHNMILNITSGCYLYRDNKKNIYTNYFNYDKDNFINYLVLPNQRKNKNYHIKFFLYYFYQLVSSISIMYIELTNYIVL